MVCHWFFVVVFFKQISFYTFQQNRRLSTHAIHKESELKVKAVVMNEESAFAHDRHRLWLNKSFHSSVEMCEQ